MIDAALIADFRHRPSRALAFVSGWRKAQKIRRRLANGADDPFMEFPARPRGMQRRTYEPVCRTRDDAEERSAVGLMNFVERLGRRSRVAG
jgi:hypothetical protein